MEKSKNPSFHHVWIRNALLALGVDSPPAQGETYGAIHSDSRAIQPGDFFVALKSEDWDGHPFVSKAIEAGATGVLVQEEYSDSIQERVHVFRCKDSLQAYRRLASEWRKEFSIPVAAVAGSVGKTTSKELLASMATGHFKSILKTEKSENGFVGIPKTLLQLRSHHDAAIIEVGIDEVGAMTQHLDIVAPTLGLLTAISEEHLERLKDIETVAKEEALIIKYLYKTNGQMALNYDEPYLVGYRRWVEEREDGRHLGFTLHEKPSDCIVRGRVGKDSKRIEVNGGPFKGESYDLPLPGEHNAMNFMGALTCAILLGVTPTEAKNGLLAFKNPSGRNEVQTLPKGTHLLADYYNANPASVRAAMATLEELFQKANHPGKKWICLGDMLEMGQDEERIHRMLAPAIQAYAFDEVLLFGDRMKWLNQELKKTKAFRGHVQHFETRLQLADYLKTKLEANDFVLIKGSRGMKMEEVLQKLQS